MKDWNSNQYLKFKNQRTQPAFDLAGRVIDRAPKAIVDIGCGPGNSTAVSAHPGDGRAAGVGPVRREARSE